MSENRESVIHTEDGGLMIICESREKAALIQELIDKVSKLNLADRLAILDMARGMVEGASR